MLPVVLLISLFAAGSLGYEQPEPPKKVIHLPIPKAVTQHKPLRQDQAFDHHEQVPIKKTEVRRVIQKVPLIHEVPIFIQKNKPFYTPVIRPKPLVVHEVVGLPVIRDKHVIQPMYIDRPYIVEKKQFVDQPYPVEKPVPIDFVKKITKVYDRKVEVPHIVNVPLVKTVDRPRPVPFTREVLQYYDVHVDVPRPRVVKVNRHRTQVEQVPYETPDLVIRKRPVHHEVNEFVPRVPQGIDGQVLAGTREDFAITEEARRFGPASGGRVISVNRGPSPLGPVGVPEPRIIGEDVVDAQTGSRDVGPRPVRVGAPVLDRVLGRNGNPYILDRSITFAAGGGQVPIVPIGGGAVGLGGINTGPNVVGPVSGPGPAIGPGPVGVVGGPGPGGFGVGGGPGPAGGGVGVLVGGGRIGGGARFGGGGGGGGARFGGGGARFGSGSVVVPRGGGGGGGGGGKGPDGDGGYFILNVDGPDGDGGPNKY